MAMLTLKKKPRYFDSHWIGLKRLVRSFCLGLTCDLRFDSLSTNRSDGIDLNSTYSFSLVTCHPTSGISTSK